MRKPKTLGRAMICPFRVEERFKYTNLDDKALVIESKTEKFMNCYRRKCPILSDPGNAFPVAGVRDWQAKGAAGAETTITGKDG